VKSALRSFSSSFAACSAGDRSPGRAPRASPRRPCRGSDRPGDPGGTPRTPRSFSPVPRNLIPTPVTEAIDSAAPPRASPSIFVRIRPLTGTARRKAWATATASWPSSRRRRAASSTGMHRPASTGADLGHQRLVDREAAGRVEDDRVPGEPPRRSRATPGRCRPRTYPRGADGPGCRAPCPAFPAGRPPRVAAGPPATSSGPAALADDVSGELRRGGRPCPSPGARRAR
jgi:hypothetical protein